MLKFGREQADCQGVDSRALGTGNPKPGAMSHEPIAQSP